MSKSDGFIEGYTKAERQFYAGLEFENPYEEGTVEYLGFIEAVYDFTQK